MRHTYEPLKRMDIEIGEHRLFTTIVIAALIPLYSDEGQFADIFDALFGGRKMGVKRRQLREAFATMTGDESPSILPELVRDYLIPKFIQYCNTQNVKVSEDEGESEAFILEYMASILEVGIQCHRPDMVDSEGVICESYPKSGQPLHVLKAANGWLPLLDTSRLPLRLQARFASAPYCPAFEGMVLSKIQICSNTLRDMEQLQPRLALLTSRSLLYCEEDRLPLSMAHLTLRYEEPKSMIKAVKEDTTLVNLSRDDRRCVDPWENAVISSAGWGALSGLGLASALTVLTELELGLSFGSLIFLEGLPLAGLITLIAVGVGLAGKEISKGYCEALVRVFEHLREDSPNYKDAAQILDSHLNHSPVKKFLGELFLTNEHLAVAHFFRGLCEEELEKSQSSSPERTHQKRVAYEHYTQAAVYAKRANREFIEFISKLCCLRLLKKSKYRELALGAGDGSIKKIRNAMLQDLSTNYKNSFDDFYAKLQHNMIILMRIFVDNSSISHHEVSVANMFLRFHDFYLLEYVGEGDGALMHVVGLCVQALLLAKLHQTHPKQGLDEATQVQLLSQSKIIGDIEDDLNLALASEKLCKAAGIITDLKVQYSQRIEEQPNFGTWVAKIEDLILDFHAHCYKKGKFFKKNFDSIVSTLGIPEERAAQILADTQYKIELLNLIEKSFNKRLLSLFDWFSVLEKRTPFNDLIDPSSGDTMLHLLTRIPFVDDADISARIKPIANLLKNQVYVRNRANETPLFVLKGNNPYGTVVDIFPESTPGDDIKAFGAEALPSFEDRKKLLQHLLRDKRISDENILKIAESMNGFSSFELEETVKLLKTSIVDINEELVLQFIDHCKRKKKPRSSILEDIKKAVWNCCDVYISSKVMVASSLDSIFSPSASQKQTYKQNVQKSLSIAFDDKTFQELILSYYDRIQGDRIPALREKSEYLAFLITPKKDEKDRFDLIKTLCKKVKYVAIENMESEFAQLLARYIENAWAAVSPEPIITNANVAFFRPTSEPTTETKEGQTYSRMDTKMKIFKTAFIHYVDKTYRLFAVLTQEDVNRKKEDALSTFSSMIKSTDVKIGVNIPLLGGIGVNISQVIGGIIDVFQMMNGSLDNRRMRMLCHCFPGDETQRFEAITLAALKLSVELAPELYHMPDGAIEVLAELVVTRIVSYMTQSEHNVHEVYPNLFQRTLTGAQSIFYTKISSGTAIQKDLKTICQDGMRVPRGTSELSKLSRKVLPTKKDSPTYQDILDNYGRIIANEDGSVDFIKPKHGKAYCMAPSSNEKVVSRIEANLPTHLQDILNVCVDVYLAEMSNDDPIIPDNIFCHRRQRQQFTGANYKLESVN